MPDLWMDVDAALAEVPVNLFPLIDDTDFKTRETGITFDQAGMDLVWNFVTTAGAYTQTAVTPTDTAGDYDWVNQGNGMYSIEIPASGGASINNNTEGFGWFTGVATGILPWAGPIIGFRAAGLNNALVDSAYSATRGLAGTAVPDAAADAAGGLPISDAGGLDLDARLDAAITSRLAPATPGRTLVVDANGLADANTVKVGPTGSGTAQTAGDIIGDTNDIQTRLPAALVGGRIAANAEVVGDKTGYALGVGGIGATAFAAGAIDAASLAADAGLEIADAVADEAYDGVVTLRQSIRLANSANGAKLSGAATTNVLIRDLADTKVRMDATVDADGNRTAVTRDLT